MSLLLESLLSFGLNFAVAFFIVRYIYYPRQRKQSYVMALLVLNTVVFFVMGLLNQGDIGLGVGFGLFAIFSILRYRTDTIPIREMTYLFVLIALPVINSVSIIARPQAFLVANTATIGVLWLVERGWGFRYEKRKTVTYGRIDLIRPEHRQALLDDLHQLTGLPVTRVSIGRLNFVKGVVDLKVYYDAHSLNAEDDDLSLEDDSSES